MDMNFSPIKKKIIIKIADLPTPFFFQHVTVNTHIYFLWPRDGILVSGKSSNFKP